MPNSKRILNSLESRNFVFVTFIFFHNWSTIYHRRTIRIIVDFAVKYDIQIVSIIFTAVIICYII